MSRKAFVDVVREVGIEGEPPLTVRPYPDDPAGLVQIAAVSSEAKEYWGDLQVAIPRDMAIALGKALIATAEEPQS